MKIARTLAALAACVIALLSAQPAGAETFRAVMIRVIYSDTPDSGAFFLKKNFDDAAQEMHDFFDETTFGQLDFGVSFVQVKLSGSRDSYWPACGDSHCETASLLTDAVSAAYKSGVSFSGLNGIAILSPGCWPGFGDHTPFGARALLGSTYQTAYDFECGDDPSYYAPPGKSGIWWGGWSHEFGHQIQLWHGTKLGGAWNGHPSEYASGYDLMDSCYPCHSGSYSIAGPPVMNGAKQVFPGPLPAFRVTTIDASTAGPTAHSVLLAPLAQQPDKMGSGQAAIQIPIGKGAYYFVQARTRYRADLRHTGPGIFDEGIQIQRVDESADPPVTPINACQYTVIYGCIYQADPTKPGYDKRTDKCGPFRLLSDSQPYCWPFALFHVGDSFADKDNRIRVHVDGVVGSGPTRAFHVTVTRGTLVTRPELFISPWFTPPMYTWETTDIWVDSSCNGYEADVGIAGLRYGRRSDGTVVGSGDDPCANHSNRIYATIHNGGPVGALDVVVDFEAATKLSGDLSSDIYCGSGDWHYVGSATISLLLPGKSESVYVPWIPKIDLTPAQIDAGHFSKHACLRVTIEPDPDELTTDYHQAIENINIFEAREYVISKSFPPLHVDLSLRNDAATSASPFGAAETTSTNPHPKHVASGRRRPRHYTSMRMFDNPRRFDVEVLTDMPPEWTFLIGNSQRMRRFGDVGDWVLRQGQEQRIPLRVMVPPGARIGDMRFVKFGVSTGVEFYNAAIPRRSGMRNRHLGFEQLGGAGIFVHTVIASDLTLEAHVQNARTIAFSGGLTPVHRGVIIAVDLADRRGNVTTKLVRTDSHGHYAGSFATPNAVVGIVRSLWQGDTDHSSAVSHPVAVTPTAQPTRRPLPLPIFTFAPRTPRPQTPPPQQTPPPNPNATPFNPNATPTPTFNPNATPTPQ